MTQKLNSLVDSFLTSDAVDIEWLSKTVGQRPLRTFWMTTESHLIDDFIPDYTCDVHFLLLFQWVHVVQIEDLE